MGITSVDSIYMSSASLQTISFYRTNVAVNSSVFPCSMFRSTGFPIWNSQGGTYPTVGKTATILSQSNSGSIPFQPAPSGAFNYLVGATLISPANAAVGSLFITDWIACCQLNLSETNGSFTGFSAVDRLEPTGSYGSGALIWCEVSENFSNTTSQFFFTYTNQDGTSGRNTPVIVTRPSATLGTTILPNSGTFIPLQGSDVGVRSIESLTFVSGSTLSTGKFTAALVRVLGLTNYNTNTIGNVPLEFDFLTNIPCPEKVYDDSYITFIIWPATTIFHIASGQLRLVPK